MSSVQQIVDLTSDLIRFPSMHSRPEEIHRCADFIMAWCARNGIHAERINHNGTPSIMVLPEKGKTKLLLMAHIDVVDAEEEMFVPRVENDRLYGRGANDDKYAVALGLILFKERFDAIRAKGGNQADMALGLLITGDEEVGGGNGAAIALRMVKADYVVALDGGDPGRVITKEKGIIDLKLTCHGQAAHGARPWNGTNAIEVLINDYAKIKALFTEENDEHWHRTINFGKIQAGESTNKVPDIAEGWFNIRYTENDDKDALIDKIRKTASGDVTVIRTVPVFLSDPHPHTDRLLQIAGAVTDKEHGASDARYLGENGLVGVVWGAEGFGTLHSKDECLHIPSVQKLHETLSALTREMEDA
ncbi:M20 family metallopeptidase [Oleidesulfovibrio sp.]|uniref:M20 family metallopeptidase n=1 Tax=Oleidesulfovibrio sp. TaxID=2909707 RepID=UPI003A89ED06